jgi:hypothetical protein
LQIIFIYRLQVYGYVWSFEEESGNLSFGSSVIDVYSHKIGKNITDIPAERDDHICELLLEHLSSHPCSKYV